MKETRHTEIRAQQNDENEMIITGTPIVFEQRTKINDPMVGSYNEVIKRSALKGVDLGDTRLLINHEMNKIPLAKSPKTLALSIDDDGLHIRAKLPDTEEGRSVYQAIKREDMTGMSFSFTCDKGGNHYDPETRTRTISKFRKIYECSIVNFPAYEQASVEARSQMQVAEENETLRKQAKISLNKILMKEL